MSDMHVTERTAGAWHIVTVTGHVDNTTAETLGAALKTAAGVHPQVAMDCSGVEYISSAGLGALLMGARAALNASHQFRVCAPSPRVQQLFDISRVGALLNIQRELP